MLLSILLLDLFHSARKWDHSWLINVSNHIKAHSNSECGGSHSETPTDYLSFWFTEILWCSWHHTKHRKRHSPIPHWAYSLRALFVTYRLHCVKSSAGLHHLRESPPVCRGSMQPATLFQRAKYTHTGMPGQLCLAPPPGEQCASSMLDKEMPTGPWAGWVRRLLVCSVHLGEHCPNCSFKQLRYKIHRVTRQWSDLKVVQMSLLWVNVVLQRSFLQGIITGRLCRKVCSMEGFKFWKTCLTVKD